MITTVIFDIDGTLYDYNFGHSAAMKALSAYTLEHFGRSAAETKSAFSEAFAYLTERLGHTAASHNRLLRIQQMLIWWDEPVIPHAMNMAKLYWDTLISVSEPMTGLISLMKALRSQGIQIGIGTNMTAMIQFQKIEHLGLSPYIDFVVTSEQCTVEKPEKAFFDLCLEVGKCKAEETVFIGDDIINDFYGSTMAGMYGIWYNPSYLTPVLPEKLSDLSANDHNVENTAKKESAEHLNVPQIHNYQDCLNGQNIILGNLTLPLLQ